MAFVKGRDGVKTKAFAGMKRQQKVRRVAKIRASKQQPVKR
jgi:hypothetical protein